MTCTQFVILGKDGIVSNTIVCRNPIQKLRVSDGRHVWVEWPPYCGPIVWLDRHCTRDIFEWWDDKAIVVALEWFRSRGFRA